jgi:hypothetical protein
VQDSKTCSRQTLATGDFTVVERCGCGAVHLTIGAITLRLPAPAVLALATTLQDAARALVLQDALAIPRSRDELAS